MGLSLITWEAELRKRRTRHEQRVCDADAAARAGWLDAWARGLVEPHFASELAAIEQEQRDLDAAFAALQRDHAAATLCTAADEPESQEVLPC